MTIKEIFKINGKTVDELDGDYKSILTNILNQLSDITPFLNSDHYFNYKITDKETGSFDFKLPYALHKRVIETYIISSQNQLP